METKTPSLSPGPFQCQPLGQTTAFNQRVTETVTERYFAQHTSEHQAHVAITTALLSHRAPARPPLTPGSYHHSGQPQQATLSTLGSARILFLLFPPFTHNLRTSIQACIRQVPAACLSEHSHVSLQQTAAGSWCFEDFLQTSF